MNLFLVTFPEQLNKKLSCVFSITVFFCLHQNFFVKCRAVKILYLDISVAVVPNCSYNIIVLPYRFIYMK